MKKKLCYVFCLVITLGLSIGCGKTKDDSKVIDLGAEKSVSTINWKTSGSTAGITKFNVQISTDGTTYNKLYDYDNSSANEGANGVIPIYQKARYIKFNIIIYFSDK